MNNKNLDDRPIEMGKKKFEISEFPDGKGLNQNFKFQKAPKTS